MWRSVLSRKKGPNYGANAFTESTIIKTTYYHPESPGRMSIPAFCLTQMPESDPDTCWKTGEAILAASHRAGASHGLKNGVPTVISKFDKNPEYYREGYPKVDKVTNLCF